MVSDAVRPNAPDFVARTTARGGRDRLSPSGADLPVMVKISRSEGSFLPSPGCSPEHGERPAVEFLPLGAVHAFRNETWAIPSKTGIALCKRGRCPALSRFVG